MLVLILNKFFLSQLLNIIALFTLKLNLLTCHYLHLILAHHLSSNLYLSLLSPLSLHMLASYGFYLLVRQRLLIPETLSLFAFDTAQRTIVQLGVCVLLSIV
jgi:hypothetical protein